MIFSVDLTNHNPPNLIIASLDRLVLTYDATCFTMGRTSHGKNSMGFAIIALKLSYKNLQQVTKRNLHL